MAIKKNDNDTLFVVLILIIAGLWLIYDKPLESSPITSSQTQKMGAEENIHTDHKRTYRQQNINKLATDAANRKLSAITDLDREGNSKISSPGLKLRGRNVINDVASDIAQVSGPDFEAPPTPDQRISSLVERDYWLTEYEKVRDKEFVNAFLQRALEAGVEIELNERLEIIGIQKKDEPEAIRFPQSEGAGGGGTR